MACPHACLLVFYSILTIAAPAQTYTILHNFQGALDGEHPATPLVQGFDGQFYGTTPINVNGPGGWGTFFKIGRYGKFTILYNFANNPDGDASPENTLLEMRVEPSMERQKAQALLALTRNCTRCRKPLVSEFPSASRRQSSD